MRCWLFLIGMLASISLVCMPSRSWASTDATAPSIIHAPVQYPEASVSAREEGVAVVVAEIDTDGHVSEARIDTSSGYPDLDAAALRSIAGWTFKPAMKDGRPVAEWVKQPVDFRLSYSEPSSISRLSTTATLGGLLSLLGGLVWIVGFAWSAVLAKRRSILWLSFMVAVWGITYPLFVAMHWSAAKRNLVLVSSGLFLSGLGLYITHLQ